MSKKMIPLLPCPFCGWQPPFTDRASMLDVLHPSATWWADVTRGGLKHRTYRSHAKRQEGDKQCWEMNCTGNMGGCGVSMTRDSRDEVIAAWNKRVAKAEGR